MTPDETSALRADVGKLHEQTSRLASVVAALQAQIDHTTFAGDREREALQARVDDLRDIVCDPSDPQSLNNRVVVIDTRVKRIEDEQATARRERRGILDALPVSAEEAGRLGEAMRKWGPWSIAALFFLALIWLMVTGDPIGAFERVWKIVNPPVTVTLDQPVPVTNVPPDSATSNP